MANFGRHYLKRNVRDFGELKRAVKEGRVVAAS
jgi:hypothetical protein